MTVRETSAVLGMTMGETSAVARNDQWGKTRWPLRRKERLDQSRDRVGLVVVQHMSGIHDDFETGAADVCQPAAHDGESIAARIALRSAGKPAQDRRVRGG